VPQRNVTAYLCSNTTIVWVIGRTAVNGQSDLPAARVSETPGRACARVHKRVQSREALRHVTVTP
jgi:hypothetical protein